MKERPLVLDEVELARVPALLERACGVTLAVGNAKFLKIAVEAAAADSELPPRAFLRKIEDGDDVCIHRLVDHAVIGETYFFRHREHFRALRKHLLQNFGNEKISAWSAGCATGEEPYTLAMTLLDAGYSADQVRILATDVSSKSIHRARTAEYGAWSFRQVESTERERFFEGPERSRPVKAVREMVEFRRHNLIHEAPPDTGFHIIFCRNVFIYFVPKTANRVLRQMADALRPGGFLFLSTTELSIASGLKFETLKVEGGAVLRKPVETARSRRPATTPSPAPKAPSPKSKGVSTSAVGPQTAALHSKRRAQPKSHPSAGLETGVTAPHRSSGTAQGRFRDALKAAREGRIEDAELLARECGTDEFAAEAFLLLSMIAESKDDLSTAVAEARRALYLDPGLAQAHAALASLFSRLGLPSEAKRARGNALSAINGLPDETLLPGVEELTAGALRRALAGSNLSAARKLRRP